MNRYLIRIIELTLLVALVLSTSLGTEGAILEALKGGDHTIAQKEWNPLSDRKGIFAELTQTGTTYWRCGWYEEEIDKEISIILKDAQQGDADAQFLLGRMYEGGIDVPKDFAKAFMWFNVATKEDPEFKLYRYKIEKKMTPQQITEGLRLTDVWMEYYKKK
jgi:hypothetical protein